MAVDITCIPWEDDSGLDFSRDCTITIVKIDSASLWQADCCDCGDGAQHSKDGGRKLHIERWVDDVLLLDSSEDIGMMIVVCMIKWVCEWAGNSNIWLYERREILLYSGESTNWTILSIVKLYYIDASLELLYLSLIRLGSIRKGLSGAGLPLWNTSWKLKYKIHLGDDVMLRHNTSLLWNTQDIWHTYANY